MVVFIGDGTLGQGVIYEAFNMASLWQAPLLIVVENNHIAQTTPTSHTLAGGIMQRFMAFGIPAIELDTSDVMEIAAASLHLMKEVHEEVSPRALILNTQRFGPHSKGDDTRPEAEVLYLKKNRDPLSLIEARLSTQEVEHIKKAVEDEVIEAFTQALSDQPARSEAVA